MRYVVLLPLLAALALASINADAQKQATPKVPAQAKLVAEFKEQGASDMVALCAAHAVGTTKGHGAYKSYAFDAKQLKDGKHEDWNAPMEAGMVQPMAVRVTLLGKGVNRTGQEINLQIRCGVNGSKVDAFITRDTSIKIKTKS
jgi:hypothetical protein